MSPLDQYDGNHELIIHAVDDLAREFAGVFSPETVRRFVAESSDALAESKVKQFVPLFVHRFAKKRLKRSPRRKEF